MTYSEFVAKLPENVNIKLYDSSVISVATWLNLLTALGCQDKIMSDCEIQLVFD